jgi:hypothetical protein
MMLIEVRVSTESGWQVFRSEVPDGSDQECYVLPKINGQPACRAEFWSNKFGRPMPKGRGLIWEVV